MDATENKSILLFDGICNLCNGAVQFVIKHDKKENFKFTALQSESGKKLLEKFNLNRIDFDSFVLIQNNQYYIKSTAALRVAKKLEGMITLLYIFIIVPTFIRDGVYSWIAKNRYRWFGKHDSCMIPTPELKSRFLD
jgi:predicted DCC family thiol-disulfide oxidoreductase YuxK